MYLSPLSIQFIWHPEDKETVFPIVEYCKQKLSRNPDNSFLHSLDFPIFCYTSKNDDLPPEINTMAEKTLVFAFVGSSIIASDEWTEYLSEVEKKDGVKVIYIALDRTALNYISPSNAIRYGDYIKKYQDIELSRRMFVEISHEIYRWLFCFKDHKQLKLFISHAKSDDNGVKLAKELKSFIDSDTKMSNFFDVNDIQNGDDFDDAIIESIKESTLIIVHSNSYSARFWCQKEVICAKENDRPIVEVNCIDGIEDRSFPLMCNYPSIRYNNALEVLEFALMETVRFQYCDKLMGMYKNNSYFTNAKTFNRVPDSFMLKDVAEPEIVYPEPELYADESEKLTDKPMHTPLSFSKSNISGKRFGISISDSPEEDMARLGQDKSHLKCLAKILAQKIIRNDALLMYGGDLRPNGFTQFLFEEAKVVSNHSPNEKKILIENYTSWPMQQSDSSELKQWTAEHRGVCKFINCGLPSDVDYTTCDEITGYIWGRCLTDMRKRMIDVSDVRICAGGKISDFKGCMPGILEEVLLAVEQKKPVFLLGGFGGMSERICRYLSTKILPEELTIEWQLSKSFEYQKTAKDYEAQKIDIDYSKVLSLGISSLNNGLSTEQNNRLFVTPFQDEVITLISVGLRNLFPEQ